MVIVADGSDIINVIVADGSDELDTGLGHQAISGFRFLDPQKRHKGRLFRLVI